MDDKSKLLLGASGIAAVIGVLLVTKEVPAQGMGKLTGRVTDSVTGQGLAEATVSISGVTVFTSSFGNFSINDIEPGSYIVTVAKSGYTSATF